LARAGRNLACAGGSVGSRWASLCGSVHAPGYLSEHMFANGRREPEQGA